MPGVVNHTLEGSSCASGTEGATLFACLDGGVAVVVARNDHTAHGTRTCKSKVEELPISCLALSAYIHIASALYTV